MKILDIKSGVSELKKIEYNGHSLIDCNFEYLRKFNDGYENLFLSNLITLTGYYVDEMNGAGVLGKYYELSNDIFYTSSCAFGHELMHVSSYDKKTDRLGFFDENKSALGRILLEGLTEYHSFQAYPGYESNSYVFPKLVAMLLSRYDNITKSFFKADSEMFMSCFNNKIDIYSLMYSLDYYYSYVTDISLESRKKEIEFQDKFISSFKNIIDMLIKIELEKNKTISKEYYELLMDELNLYKCELEIGRCYSKCRKYAYKELKRKIK